MGLIPEEVIREMRARIDIVAVIGQHVQLRKAGHNHVGLCPFHRERTPSFTVSGEKGFFYCFGCHKKGDVFSFLMDYEGKSFVEVVEGLAAAAGFELPRQGRPRLAAERSRRTLLLEINRRACDFFRQTLLHPRRGARARDYLRSRDIDEATAEKFQLGYAPAQWRGLLDFLGSEVAMELVVEVGLAVPQPRAGGYYDRFRDRLMCPVIVAGGDVVGFSGRALADGGDGAAAKYINSPESPVYKKSKLLYGLHVAREAFSRRRAVLVEGNFDVLTLHQAGFAETVAPLGTALTEEQAVLLRRLAGSVLLLYDGDRAGREATLKSLKTLVAAEVPVTVAALPDGSDPDSYLRQLGREKLGQLLDRAQPGIEFFAYEVWSKHDASADGRARALAQAAEVIASVKNQTQRDLLVGTLAAAMSVDVSLVRKALARRPNGQTPRNDASPPQGPGGVADSPPREELHLVAILAEHPELVELAEECDVFSLLTDGRLRDMYCAARKGQPLLTAVPEDLSPLVVKHVLAGSYASVKNPAHCLREAVEVLRRHRRRGKLAAMQREAQAAKRRGDAALERELVREILSTRRQVD